MTLIIGNCFNYDVMRIKRIPLSKPKKKLVPKLLNIFMKD